MDSKHEAERLDQELQRLKQEVWTPPYPPLALHLSRRRSKVADLMTSLDQILLKELNILIMSTFSEVHSSNYDCGAVSTGSEPLWRMTSYSDSQSQIFCRRVSFADRMHYITSLLRCFLWLKRVQFVS